MIKRVKQIKDPRSCPFGIGGLFLWGHWALPVFNILGALVS